MIAARRMIDFREFAGAVMRALEFAGSSEHLHLRFVDGKAPDLICHSSGGGGAKPGGAAK